jgi:cellulose synthase/poly-beta-1,6-N-acetylglucosamine synthase-like glycosyltransferase
VAEDEAAQPDAADDDAQAEAAGSEVDAEAAGSEVDADQAEVPVFPIRRKRRGGVLGAAMLGLEQALYGPRQNEIVMVADADGMPEPDFDVQLTADPKDSYVVMRKQWWRRRHNA